jgi:hypothetical protein
MHATPATRRNIKALVRRLARGAQGQAQGYIKRPASLHGRRLMLVSRDGRRRGAVHRYGATVTDEIRRLPAAELDEGVEESWERSVDDPDIRGVDAARITFGEEPYWQVAVAVAEFLRADPLETELRQRIAAALRAVGGIEAVGEEDREVWLVTGTPSGEALVGAAAQVVDHLAARTRAYIDSL